MRSKGDLDFLLSLMMTFNNLGGIQLQATLVRSSLMIVNGQHICDFCGVPIPHGEDYISYTATANEVDELHAVTEADPDLAVTTTTNPDGSVRLDVCLECRLRAMPTTERVQ